MTDDARWLRDRVEIEKLVFLYAKGNDEGSHWFDECMTDDVEVVYDFGTWRGLEEHKRMRDTTIPVAFTFTQHDITNPIIEIDGDVGRGQYYVTAAHGMTGKDGKPAVVYAGAIYTHDVVRTPKGWRIKRHHCVTRWVDDEGGLMQAVSTAFEDSTA